MGAADDFLKGFFKQYPEAQNGELNLDELNGLMAAYQQQMNDRPLEDFDGLSPAQMELLLHAPLTAESPLKLREGIEDELRLVPIFTLLEMLIEEIRAAGTLKLTMTGNLPVRVCTLLYKQNLMGYEYQLSSERIREDEVSYLWPLKQYALDTGIVKKRNNALSLTKQGEKYMKAAKVTQFTALLKYFTTHFHWGNLYGLEDMGRAGQMGWAYSLVLLFRYGSNANTSGFYSGKLLQAFGKDLFAPGAGDVELLADYHYAYAVRFFECFADWFGLVQIERGNDYTQPLPERLIVRKSDLFDRLFQVL